MTFYIPDAVMDEVSRRYQAGESSLDLAKELGTTYQTVIRRLRTLGVPVRGRGAGASGGRKLSEARSAKIDEAKLRELHGQGLSTDEIGATLDPPVSAEAVRRRMKKLDLPRLPPKSRPERNSFWRGGLSVDDAGYILQKVPSHPAATKHGYVRQHRLVMEGILGRYLTSGEVVDHRNGDPSDNRPENLRLFASNGEHLSATRTGRAKLTREQRRAVTEEAVLRARRRVAAILAESGTGADQSP